MAVLAGEVQRGEARFVPDVDVGFRSDEDFDAPRISIPSRLVKRRVPVLNRAGDKGGDRRHKKQVHSDNKASEVDILGHFGTFWDILGHFGTFWDILGHSRTFWTIRRTFW